MLNEPDFAFEIAQALASNTPEEDQPTRGRIRDSSESSLIRLEQAVWSDISRSGPLWSNVRVVLNGVDQHPSRFMGARIGDGLVAHSWLRTDAVSSYLNQGATFVYNHLQDSSPTIQRLQEALEYQLDARVWVQAYLTKAGQTAFGAHVDDHNFCILQLFGAKDWQLGNTSGTDQSVGETERLKRGEFFVVPANTMHAVSGIGGLSLHLTLAYDWAHSNSRWGSSLNDHEQESFTREKRMGASWPFDLSALGDTHMYRFRLASRRAPDVEIEGQELRLTWGTSSVRLNAGLSPIISELVSGRSLSLSEATSLTDFPEDQISQMLSKLCEARVLLSI